MKFMTDMTVKNLPQYMAVAERQKQDRLAQQQAEDKQAQMDRMDLLGRKFLAMGDYSAEGIQSFMGKNNVSMKTAEVLMNMVATHRKQEMAKKTYDQGVTEHTDSMAQQGLDRTSREGIANNRNATTVSEGALNRGSREGIANSTKTTTASTNLAKGNMAAKNDGVSYLKDYFGMSKDNFVPDPKVQGKFSEGTDRIMAIDDSLSEQETSRRVAKVLTDFTEDKAIDTVLSDLPTSSSDKFGINDSSVAKVKKALLTASPEEVFETLTSDKHGWSDKRAEKLINKAVPKAKGAASTAKPKVATPPGQGVGNSGYDPQTDPQANPLGLMMKGA